MYGMTFREFLDCRPCDVHRFLMAKYKKAQIDIEQNWDYVRYIMLGSLMPHSKKQLKPSDILKLERDGLNQLFTNQLPEEQQAKIKAWNAQMDAEMGLV